MCFWKHKFKSELEEIPYLGSGVGAWWFYWDMSCLLVEKLRYCKLQGRAKKEKKNPEMIIKLTFFIKDKL